MQSGTSASTPSDPAPNPVRTAWSDERVRLSLLVVAIMVSTPLALRTSLGASQTVAVWPVAALSIGLLLLTPRRRHLLVLGALMTLLVAARIAHDGPPLVALGLGLADVAEVAVVTHLLTRGGTARPTLLHEGDVSRMLGTAGAGAGVAALGYVLTALAAGSGALGLTAAAVFGTHAAGALVLLPLFLRTPQFPAPAGRGERLMQTSILICATVAAFSIEPPVFFALIPMFSWLAFRGTLRRSTLLIATIAAGAVGLTLAGFGPVAALGPRYDLPPELVNGILQLFILDCAVILLPLTAMMTQQRMDAAELKRRQHTLERIVTSATQTAIVTTDLDGRVQLFNPGAEALLGYPAATAVGRSMELFVTADELTLRGQELATEPTFAAVAAAMVVDGPARRLWRLARADGEQRTAQMTLSPIEDDEGHAAGFLLTAEDVTEREAARQALLSTLENQQRAVDSLRELDQVKSDFVATVSHELRTPIANILGYVEVLQDGLAGDLSAHQRDVVERVDRNGQRLKVLIEDLLLISHIERKGLDLRPDDVDLRSVVRAAHEETTSLLPGRRLEIELDLPDEPVVHRADAQRLQRVVANLLSNAVKFTPDGGRIWLRVDSGPEESRVVVGDTGVGIPAAEQERMFSRFFRSSTSMSQAVQGAGLGLTLVRAIVAGHGGRLDVESTEGVGTVVTATVPRSVPPATRYAAADDEGPLRYPATP